TPDQLPTLPTAFVALSMGTVLCFHLQPRAQTAIASATVAAYAWVLAHGPPSTGPSAMPLVVAAACVSVAAARLIERYRSNSFERTWQQEQLVSLARELAARLEPREVVARLLEHSLRLFPAPWAAVGVHDHKRRLIRIEGVWGATDRAGNPLLGFEVPLDQTGIQRIVESEVFELPTDDPGHPLVTVLANRGLHRGIFVSMRYGDELVGALHFARQSDAPFTAAERMLA